MANQKEKQYKIIINGIEESITKVELLSKRLDELGKKIDSFSGKTIDIKTNPIDANIKAPDASSSVGQQKELNNERLRGLQLEKETLVEIQKQKNANKEVMQEVKQIASGVKDIDGNYANTLQGMRAELADLKHDLANTDFGSDNFNELVVKTNELNEKVKAVEQSYGQFGRNVGNYANSVKDALEGISKTKITLDIGGVKTEFDNAREASRTLKQELASLGQQMYDLEKSGKKSSDAYKQLSSRFNDVAKAQESLQKGSAYAERLANRLQDDSGAVGQLAEGFNSLNAIMQVGVGISGLFGKNQEEIQEAINRTVQVTSILEGIQKLYNQTMQSGTIANIAYHKILQLIGKEKKKQVVDNAALIVSQKAVNSATKDSASSSNLLSNAFGKATNSSNLLGNSMSKLGKSMGKIGWIALAAGLVSMLAASKEFSDLIDEILGETDSMAKLWNKLKQVISGVGNVLKTSFLDPMKSGLVVLRQLIEGDLKGALQTYLETWRKVLDIKTSYENGSKSEKKKQEDEAELKRLDSKVKTYKNLINLREAMYGADWKYTQEGKELYTAYYDYLERLYKNDDENWRQYHNERLSYERELTEHSKSEEEKRNQEAKKKAEDSKRLAEERVRQAKENAEKIRNIEDKIQKNTLALMKDGYQKQLLELRKAERDELVEAESAEYKKQELILSIQKKYAKMREDLEKEHQKKINEYNINASSNRDSLNGTTNNNLDNTKEIRNAIRDNRADVQRDLSEFVNIPFDSINKILNSKALEVTWQILHQRMIDLIADEKESTKEFEDIQSILKNFETNGGLSGIAYLKVTIDDLNKDCSSLQRQLEELNKSFEDGAIGVDEYNESTSDISSQLEGAKKSLESLEGIYKKLSKYYTSDVPEVFNINFVSENLEDSLKSAETYIFNWQSFALEKVYSYMSDSIQSIDNDLDSSIKNFSKTMNDYFTQLDFEDSFSDMGGAVQEFKEEWDELYKEIASTDIGNEVASSGEKMSVFLEKRMRDLMKKRVELEKQQENALTDEEKNYIENLIKLNENGYKTLSSIIELYETKRINVMEEYNNSELDIYREYYNQRLEIIKSHYESLEDVREKYSPRVQTTNQDIDTLANFSTQLIYANKLVASYKLLNNEIKEEQKNNADTIVLIQQGIERTKKSIASKRDEIDATKDLINQTVINIEEIESALDSLEGEEREVQESILNQEKLYLESLHKDVRTLETEIERLQGNIDKDNAKIISLKGVNQNLKEVGIAIQSFIDKNTKDWKEWSKAIASVFNAVIQMSTQALSQISEMQYNNALKDIEEQEKLLDKKISDLEKAFDKEEELYQLHSDRINQIEGQLESARGDRRLVLLDRLNAELNAKEQAWANEQKINKQREEAEKKQEKLQEEKDKAEKKRNLEQKKIQIAQATASTALAVVNALALQPFYLGLAMSALAASLGAVQIATIANTKYADGGVLQGKSHSQGGIKVLGGQAEVEGGEFITNKKTTAINLPLLYYINSKHKEITLEDLEEFFETPKKALVKPSKRTFANGGQIVQPLLPNIDMSKIVRVRETNERPIYVSVTEIDDVRNRMVNVREMAGIED